MKKLHHRKLFIATMLFAVQGFSHADPKSDALQVIQHRLLMPSPTTVFDKWQADQWSFAAAGCGVEAGLTKELGVIDKLPIYLDGSSRSPADQAVYCATLAKSGPVADCFNMKATQPPFTTATQGLPSNYVFLSDADSAKNGSTHMVGGYCNLVKNAPHTRQFFAGNGILKWLAEPRVQNFQTASGAQILNAGTVSFSVAGMPGHAAPQTVIVAPK